MYIYDVIYIQFDRFIFCLFEFQIFAEVFIRQRNSYKLLKC